MQLEKFKRKFIDQVLELLWRQWSALGVAGYERGVGQFVIDPEALLLVSMSFCRYDQRLFDEIIDWLTVNEKIINVQRLRTMQKVEGFGSTEIVAALACFLTRFNSTAKWRGLSAKTVADDVESEALFFSKSGTALPVVGEKDSVFLKYGYLRNPIYQRKLSSKFSPGDVTNLLLQLRALFGVNSRAEIMLYALINEKVEAVKLQEQVYFSIKSIRDSLAEMGQSGILDFPRSKRDRFYKVDEKPWLTMLLKNYSAKPKWVCWAPVFRFLETVLELFNSASFLDLSVAGKASELRELVDKYGYALIEKSGFDVSFSTNFNFTAEEFIDHFIKQLNTLLAKLNSGGY